VPVVVIVGQSRVDIAMRELWVADSGRPRLSDRSESMSIRCPRGIGPQAARPRLPSLEPKTLRRESRCHSRHSPGIRPLVGESYTTYRE
jgi:hypothetical protein